MNTENASLPEDVGLKNEFERCLKAIYQRTDLPDPEEYLALLDEINNLLDNEPESVRPRASNGSSGGLVYLRRNIPAIIVPDLHARMEFVLNLIFSADKVGETVLDKLYREEIQIVFLGDGFHSEGRGAQRWKLAFEEYKGGYAKHKSIDDEMRESLGTMEMIKILKLSFPELIHFLKGNHENIANENGEGNHPFRKYAYEGPMVAEYVQKFYGDDFFDAYYQFEKKLPILAVGNGFMVSHAEPAAFYDKQSVIEYRQNAAVVEGLTWTNNDAAEPGSVEKMLDHYLGELECRYYFGGHRPVEDKYALRADGEFIQINNPGRYIVALIIDGESFQPETGVLEIPDNMKKIMARQDGRT